LPRDFFKSPRLSGGTQTWGIGGGFPDWPPVGDGSFDLWAEPTATCHRVVECNLWRVSVMVEPAGGQ